MYEKLGRQWIMSLLKLRFAVTLAEIDQTQAYFPQHFIIYFILGCDYLYQLLLDLYINQEVPQDF